MNQKIRTAQLQKVPYMLVVGDREMEAGAIAVRPARRGRPGGDGGGRVPGVADRGSPITGKKGMRIKKPVA